MDILLLLLLYKPKNSKTNSDCQNGRNTEKRKTMEKVSNDSAEGLKTMGMRNWHTVARYQKEWRRATMLANVNNRL